MSSVYAAVSRWAGIFLAMLTFVAFDPGRASAQLRRLTAPVVTPRLLVAPGDARAVDLNPADLAMARELSVVFSHVGGAALSSRGDALSVGLPLPFGLAVGASGQLVRRLAEPSAAHLALAGAFAPDARVGVGASLRWIGSAGGLGGLVTWDLALTYRPSPRLGLVLIGSDLFGPLQFVPAGVTLPATVQAGVALRPFEHDGVTLEGSFAIDTVGEIGARALIEARIPYLGRAQALAEIDGLSSTGPAALRLMGVLAVDWEQLGLETGIVREAQYGYYIAASVRGRSHEGLPERRVLLDLEVSSLGPRAIIALLERLRRARDDRRVGAVLLRVRNSGIGMAYAQELRLAIDALQRRGKPVACHLESAKGSEVYACSTAARVWIDPAGEVKPIGPSFEMISLGRLLGSLGIRADILRIGDYKSAPEQLMNERVSVPAREERERLLDDLIRRLAVDLSRDRGVSEDVIREVIDRSPYRADEAVTAGLAHASADEYDLDEPLRAWLGRSLPRHEDPPERAPRSFGAARRIGLVVVDGSIVDGENIDIPIVDIHMSGGRTVVEAIEALASDPNVAAIVVRIDSSGGSALASDQIWRALRRARQRKPVLASMGAVAASGGYYVASAAQEIWALPSTLTGSIGLYNGKVDVEQLAERLGVHVEQLRRGQRAGSESIFRPFSSDERAMLADKTRQIYRLFLRRVAEGRAMDAARVHELGQGRIYSGDRAKEIGLVDRLGGLQSALARARQLARLPADAPVVVLPSRPGSLLEYALSSGAQGDASAGLLSPLLRRAAELIVGAEQGPHGQPLVMMDTIIEPP